MSTEPRVGDLVDITIKRARVTAGPNEHVQGRSFVVAVPGRNQPWHFNVCPDVAAVTVDVVEPARPANWPPRAGDLWRDRDGDLWFALDVRRSAPIPIIELVAAVTDAKTQHPAAVHREHGPLALVRRELDGS